jgi:hypothetical protein
MRIEWDEAEIATFLSFTPHQWTSPCVDGGFAPSCREQGCRGLCDRRAGIGAWTSGVGAHTLGAWSPRHGLVLGLESHNVAIGDMVTIVGA